ncbi:MAG: transcriptional regulator, LuxR family, partial [Solirubrobacterales bacterium]|nr:transcriptional regulator, LuxR family [Solirubrobacterales bacterium]
MTGEAQGTGGVGLLERAHALEAVEDTLSLAAGGTGRLLLIEGAAGIGKSRVLDAARARASAAGFRVLAARGGELERDFSCGVALQLFERPVRALAPPDRERLLSRLPRPVAALFGSPASVDALDEAGGFALLHGLFLLTSELAERGPLALAIDDVHWADEPTVRFLLYLVARLGDLPVAILTAGRPAGHAGAGELVTRLAAGGDTRVERLEPLGTASVASIVRAELDYGVPEEVCAACRELTGGNPFYLHELLLTLVADRVDAGWLTPDRLRELSPASIARAVLLRAARLPAGAAA